MFVKKKIEKNLTKFAKKTLDFFHQLRYNNNRKKTTQISWDNTTTLKKLWGKKFYITKLGEIVYD